MRIMWTHCIIYQLSSSSYYNDALVSLVFINYIIGDSSDGRYNNIHYCCTYTKMERIKMWLWLPLCIVLKRNGTIINNNKIKKKWKKYHIRSLAILASLRQGRRGTCTLFFIFVISNTLEVRSHTHTHTHTQTCYTYIYI
jgi:hypothetical protein